MHETAILTAATASFKACGAATKLVLADSGVIGAADTAVHSIADHAGSRVALAAHLRLTDVAPSRSRVATLTDGILTTLAKHNCPAIDTKHVRTPFAVADVAPIAEIFAASGAE